MFARMGVMRALNRGHVREFNLPPMPGVFPDYPAPVVRNADDERELIMMRWGMPPLPDDVLKIVMRGADKEDKIAA
jgi:putative SOS response-associated peptidase YedK